MKDQGDAKYFTTLLNRYKQQLYESCHDIVMTHFTFMVHFVHHRECAFTVFKYRIEVQYSRLCAESLLFVS